MVIKITQFQDNTNLFWNSVKELRRSVFVEEQGMNEHIVQDEFDTNCTHVLCMYDHEVIASCRVRIEDTKAYIERVIVSKYHRKKSFASRVLQEAMDFIKEEDVYSIEITAQVHAVGLYERFGFKPVSEVFDYLGIAHVRMMQRIH